MNEPFEAMLRQLVTTSESSFGLEKGIAVIQDSVRRQTDRITKAGHDATQNLEGMVELRQESTLLADQARVALDASIRGEARMEEFFGQLTGIFERVEQSEAALVQLRTKAEAMAGLVSAISDIAEILKVLGINAAIEAARAGAAGRGFGVVASEVQQLAGRASKAADEVARIIGDVTGEVRRADLVLGEAYALAKAGQASSQTVLGELQTIETTNRSLEAATLSLSEAIGERSEFAGSMKAVVADIVSDTAVINQELRETEGLTAGLHAAVSEALVLFGSIRLGVHEICVNDLTTIIREIQAPIDWPSFLARQFRRFPHFSLLYAMDRYGRQVHANAVNPRYADTIDAGGEGADRSSKPYFTEPLASGQPYTSPIYVSTASRQLCVTVSQALPGGGILAADLSLNDLLRLTAD